jgi:hypothetical protein
MSQLPAKIGRGTLAWFAAQAIASELMKLRTNRDEPYVERINREFGLRDYSRARALYDSSPAYWEKLYGSEFAQSSCISSAQLVAARDCGARSGL